MRTMTAVAILTVLFCAPAAYAYRAARVLTDQAELKDSPGSDAATHATLARGTRVNTSDNPTNGYYRVRSVSDSGWVRDTDLDFGPVPGPQPRATQPRQSQERMEDRDEHPESSSHWGIKVFAGLDFWKPSDVDALDGSNSLDGGIAFGGEVDYFFRRNLALAFRLEKLSKTATGPTPSGDVLSFELGAVPVMVGLDYELAKGENFSLDLGGYVGGAFSTHVTETDTSVASPNVTQMSATAPTFLLAADLNWHITEPFWLFGEVGYRYLKTGKSSPSVVAPSNVFTSPFAIDMSGPVLNVGLRIGF